MSSYDTLGFVVEGEPKGKDRPRLTTINGYARAYTTRNTINYENRILACYKEAVKDTKYENEYFANNDEAVMVCVVVCFGLSKADYNKSGLSKSGREKIDSVYCTKHKDLDNIVKSVLDALNGVAYHDDKQVVEIYAVKNWDIKPNVKITLKKQK